MIEFRQTYKCDICKKEVVVSEQEVHPYMLVRMVAIPDTWSIVRGKMVCEEHTVTVEDK